MNPGVTDSTSGAADGARADRPTERLLIGLTGGIGSGKSTVADLFVAHGAALVDTDAIAHELTGPSGAAMATIRAAFGPALITAEGALDRSAMRALAFTDPDARKRLETILHPRIRAQALAQIAHAATQAAYVIVAVPLLFESGEWAERVDRVLVVDCPQEVQVARTMARSALAREQIEAIMAAQIPRAERLARAHDVVDNRGDRSTLAAQVTRLHERYVELARTRSEGS